MTSNSRKYFFILLLFCLWRLKLLFIAGASPAAHCTSCLYQGAWLPYIFPQRRVHHRVLVAAMVVAECRPFFHEKTGVWYRLAISCCTRARGREERLNEGGGGLFAYRECFGRFFGSGRDFLFVFCGPCYDPYVSAPAALHA